jgi:hypothetical protein
MIKYYISYAYTNSGVMFGLGSCEASFESEVPTYEELKELEECLIKDHGYKDVGLVSFMRVRE